MIILFAKKTSRENSDLSSHVIQGINLKSGDLVDISKCTFDQHMSCHFKIQIYFLHRCIMSKSSNSEAPLLVEEEAKVQPPTSGSRSNSSHPICLPLPRFPKRLACIEVNWGNFEHGYDEQLVESSIPNQLMCSI